MPIGNITQTISELPAAGRRGVDVQTVFVNKQEDFQDHLQGTTVTELNALVEQQNTMAGAMNSTATQVNTNANTATTKAGEANTSASSASTSASEALTSRNQAETFKNNASTSASTATTKASEASASALSASTSASTTTTKAGEASASASQALTNRNQAETFAQQAKASAESVDVNNLVHRTGGETIAGIKTFSSNIVGNITGNSGTATIATDSNKLVGKNWYWSGQGGQPAWLWGGSDGNNMYVYNPSNFNVNTAVSLSTVVGSAPSYACRAWVNFNGIGTVAIRASGNVSSITDMGVGSYSVNFTIPMPDVNYCVVFSGASIWGGNNMTYSVASNGNSEAIPTTTSINVTSINTNGSVGDSKYYMVSIFR